MNPSIQKTFNEVCGTIISFVLENSTLPQREREILNLCVFQNIEIDRVASSFGLSSERVRQIVLRSLRWIKSEAERIESEYINLKDTSYNFNSLQDQNLRLKQSIIEIATISTAQVETINNEHEETVLGNNVLNKMLVDFDLSVRALSCLRSAKIDTVGQLIRCRRSDLLKFRNFGKASLRELSNLLSSLGLSFID